MNKPKSLRVTGFLLLTLLFMFAYGCSKGGSDSSDSSQDPCVNTGTPAVLGTGNSISLSGSIRYEDKAYDNSGFTGATIFRPVRFATVEVVRCSDSQVLSGAATDATGGYSLVFTNTGTASVYLRVIADTGNAEIKNSTTDNAIYSVKSGRIDDSKGSSHTANIDITVSSGAGGAFNILDVLTDGILYLKGLVVTNPPLLTAFWQTNSCDGTYFDSSDNSIHLLGGGSCPPDSFGDTDEYDDDIILHEFGHFVASSFSRDDSPGGSHTLGDNTEDIRLAWSEGWAHFLSSAIRGVSSQTDTVLSTASSFEIEGPSPLASSTIYTTSEVSVATVLWDIFDSANEAFDGLSLNINPIWDVMNVYLPSAASVSIEDFWDGWFARGHGSQTEMINISSDRKMELLSDGFETDDAPNPARKMAEGSTEHHTLYPAGDKDIVAFDVVLSQSYTIETLNLSNGADTLIEILRSDGVTLIESNDNSSNVTYVKNCVSGPPGPQECPLNDNSTLSSRVSIIAPTTGTIFARISRSLAAPDSAGIYGSYDLRITSP
ncbi:MAG: hypothetical protein AAB090_06600 [Nitrospirota bacterium]